MLMGTADVVAAPTESVVFLEDMTDVQKAEKVSKEIPLSSWHTFVVASEISHVAHHCTGRCAFSWTKKHG